MRNTCSCKRAATLGASSEGQPLGRDEILQLDFAAAHETEGRVHSSRTVHLPLVKAPHGVGVIKVHSAGVVIEAHAQTLRHGKHAVARVTGRGRGCGRGCGGGGHGYGRG